MRNLNLNWKLSLALLLIVLISVGLMFGLTNLSTAREFNQYVQSGNSMYLQMVGNNLAGYYQETESWARVQPVLQNFTMDANDRLIVADDSGQIIGDTYSRWLGRMVGQVGLSGGMPITVSGNQVGTVYLFPGSGGMGAMMNGMMGGNAGAVNSSPAAATSQQDFLDKIRADLWLAGLIAAGLAILLGVVLTRHVTRPVHALSEGARHIARGELDYRVKVKSNDEIGQLGHSFNAMAATLGKNEQERRHLFADIAHELRTPLSIIDGTVDGMLDGVFPPNRENLNSIKEETALLTRLISDLRDLSLAESGRLKLDRAPADLGKLVERKMVQAEVTAREKGISLKTAITSPLPEVNIDAARMEQVVSNVINNAIRHTPAQGSITASISRVSGRSARLGGKAGVMVSVADTGEGIPAEHLPHIFERFYRVESSRSRSSGGAGLGLAIAKQMVEAHGGRIWAESTPGAGSIFSFSLPAQ